MIIINDLLPNILKYLDHKYSIHLLFANKYYYNSIINYINNKCINIIELIENDSKLFKYYLHIIIIGYLNHKYIKYSYINNNIIINNKISINNIFYNIFNIDYKLETLKFNKLIYNKLFFTTKYTNYILKLILNTIINYISNINNNLLITKDIDSLYINNISGITKDIRILQEDISSSNSLSYFDFINKCKCKKILNKQNINIFDFINIIYFVKTSKYDMINESYISFKYKYLENNTVLKIDIKFKSNKKDFLYTQQID